MRDYEEVANNVFRRRDEQLAKDKHRALVRKRAGAAVLSFCFACTAGLYAYKYGSSGEDLRSATDMNVIEEPDDTPASTAASSAQAVTTSVTGKASQTYTTASDSGDNTVYTTTAAFISSHNDISTTAVSSSDSRQPEPENTAQERPAAVTSAAVLYPQITTTAAVPDTNIISTTSASDISAPDTELTENERSILMKKLSLFFAGLIASSAINIPAANAQQQEIINRISSIYEIEPPQEYCDIRDGKIDVDFNGNGEYDINDLRLFDWYNSYYLKGYETETTIELTPEIQSRLDSVNGKLMKYFPEDYWSNYSEAEYEYIAEDETYLQSVEFNVVVESFWFNMCQYFLDTNGFDFDYCFPSYYDPAYEGSVGYSMDEAIANYDYKFANDIYRFMYMNAEADDRYNALVKHVESGKMDLDINANGKLDEYDYLVFRMFGHKFKYSGHPMTLIGMLGDEDIYYPMSSATDEWYERLIGIVPQDDLDRAYSALKKIPFYNCEGIDFFVSIEIPKYFASHIELKPEYFTNEYFEELLPGSSPWRPGVILEGFAKLTGAIYDKYMEMEKFDPEICKSEFVDFYLAVKEGRIPEPDANMDGIINIDDALDMDFYRFGIPYGETWDDIDHDYVSITREAWDNIAANCDYNGNGLSGDEYDENFIFLYCVIENPDWFRDLNDSDDSGQGSVSTETFNAGIIEDQVFGLIADSDIERSGDADGDNQMKMNDAVLIMQSVSNGDKYKLTSREKFNGDIYNTGDGITPMDALAIQKALLENG